DQVNQPDVEEVVTHLVDEVRAPEQAMRTGLPQVALPQRGELGATETRNGLGVDRRRVPGAELAREGRDVRQLARTLDLGVAGEDLLEQGRTPARQPRQEKPVRREG